MTKLKGLLKNRIFQVFATLFIVVISFYLSIAYQRYYAYNAGKSYEQAGRYNNAVIQYAKSNGYKDADEKMTELILTEHRNRLSAGEEHSLALKNDGTVLAAGNNEKGQCEVSTWTDIISVSAGEDFSVGLRSDGTLIHTDNGSEDLEKMTQWTDIISVQSNGRTVGALKKDGTVLSTNESLDTSSWENVVMIAVSDNCIAGLNRLGKVLAVGDYAQEVSEWRYVTAIYGGVKSIACIKENDRTKMVNLTQYLRYWDPVETISCGYTHTLGISQDNTIYCSGSSGYGELETRPLGDKALEVAAGKAFTIGLQEDGTVFALGRNSHGQCDVEEWKLF